MIQPTRPAVEIAAELDRLQGRRDDFAGSPEAAGEWLLRMGRLMAEHQFASLVEDARRQSAPTPPTPL